MALVAYDNSDSSEYEDEEPNEKDTNQNAVITLNKKIELPEPSLPMSIAENTLDKTHISLFNLLPQPTNKIPTVVEEDDEFLHKKETPANIIKPKAKITVPSLSDFKDVEDTSNARPKTANGKKSDLLSMLPQPRNAVTITTSSKSLIPHVLTQKPNKTNATVKKKEPLPSPAKKAKTETTNSLMLEYSDDSDNNDEVQNDFFSMNKPVDVPIDDIPLDLDEKDTKLKTEAIKRYDQKDIWSIESNFKQDADTNHAELQANYTESNVEYTGEGASYSNGYAVPESSCSNETGLDDEAILKLCGTRGKRKREDIQIVDVNQREVLADAREWLLKGLMDDTSKRVSSSKKRGDEPTSQQRRKHQITYLAHQAKANEIELQNQWANNRLSRRQTQSKYGF